MPPDEYHSGVNNSVYTNVLVQNRSDVKLALHLPLAPQHGRQGPVRSHATVACPLSSLHFAAALAKDLGLPIPKQWLEVADRIKVPFDSELNFHPEFDGYERGEWY